MKTLILLIFTALAGCGGGSSSQNTPSTIKPEIQVQIAMYGDSTMAGATYVNGGYIITKNNAPADLQIDLQATFGDGVTTKNYGESGTTLAELLDGTDLYTTPFATEITNNPANIIVENFAINDAAHDTPEQFKQNLITFIQLSQAAGKVVVLEEPNPQCDKMTGLQIYPNPLVQVIDDTAAEYNLALIKQYDAILAIPGWCSMLSDGTHPDDALYAIKAQNEASVLAPLLAI